MISWYVAHVLLLLLLLLLLVIVVVVVVPRENKHIEGDSGG